MGLWVGEPRRPCSEAINPLECPRTLAVPPQPQATQLIDNRTARCPSCWPHHLPTHLQILPQLCSSSSYLEQGWLVWKERKPRSGLVPPRSRATSPQVPPLSLLIPTSLRR